MAKNVTDVFVEHIQRWLDEKMKKDFYKDAKEKVLRVAQPKLF